MANGASQRTGSWNDVYVLLEYWRIYGGWKALLGSIYLHAAILLAICGYGVWSKAGWWSFPQTILPNLLGFSLAGYAIFLSFGSERFRLFLSTVEVNGASAFVSLTTTFMHFVVLQVFALVLSLVADFLQRIKVPASFPFADALPYVQLGFWLFCFLLFCYSLTLIMASVTAIYRLVRMFDAYSRSTSLVTPDVESPGSDEK